MGKTTKKKNKKKKPVGYFKTKGKLISVMPKDGESKRDALNRVSDNWNYDGKIHNTPDF